MSAGSDEARLHRQSDPQLGADEVTNLIRDDRGPLGHEY
jgi:hypothetical protein